MEHATFHLTPTPGRDWYYLSYWLLSPICRKVGYRALEQENEGWGMAAPGVSSYALPGMRGSFQAAACGRTHQACHKGSYYGILRCFL